LKGLDPSHRYQLTLREGPTPARLREGKGGRAGKVFVLQSPAHALPAAHRPEDEAIHVLDLSGPLDITGAERLTFFFPDDDKSDNEGELMLEVGELKN